MIGGISDILIKLCVLDLSQLLCALMVILIFIQLGLHPDNLCCEEVAGHRCQRPVLLLRCADFRSVHVVDQSTAILYQSVCTDLLRFILFLVLCVLKEVL